jgi:predicted component of type VI protein secretion system
VATLAVYRGEQLVRKVELGDGPMRIGRSPENEIVLEDTNKGVSRMHAEIRHEDGQYIILDLNSQNGVWIRDRRVQVEPLPVDEPVTVGPYRLVLLATPLAPSSGTSIPGTLVVPGSRPPAGPEPTGRFEPAEPTSHPPLAAKTIADAPPKAAPAPARPPASAASAPGSNRLVLAAVAVAAIAAIAVIAVMMSRSGEPTETATATTTVPSPPVAEATSTVPPSGPTDEERFREHFDRAQELIAKGDKDGAAAENAQALTILADDARGLKQRSEIEALGTPTPTPPPVAAPPAGTGTPTTAANGGREAKPPASSPLSVPLKSGESTAERAKREKNARYLLDDGRKAFDEKRFADATELLQRALEVADRPDFGATPGEAANLLKQARTAKAQADAALARANAQKAFDQAKALAGSDIVTATRRLREAMAIDPKIAGGAELMASLQEQLVKNGEEALTSAKNYDRFKRFPEAIREYDRAIQLLELVQGGHKDLGFAKQRSAELKAR